MKQLRPLCLSFWIPPVIRPQAILIGKMLPEWIAQGMAPAVIAYKTDSPWDINAPVNYIPPKPLRRVTRRFPRLCRLLDKMYIEKLYRLARSVVNSYRPNVIFSFANPQDSNLLGAMLHERLALPFVSHFSDPFYDNPYKSLLSAQVDSMLEMERYIIEQSDRIIFVNSRLLELVMRKYPPKFRSRAIVVPHCFQRAGYPSPRGGKSNVFVLNHIGAFYQQRNPEMLFRAARRAMEIHPQLRDKLKIRMVGAVNDYTNYSSQEMFAMVKTCGLGAIVEFLPLVGYEESLQEMVDSDALVVIDADIPESPFLPSKLIDYIGSRREVIAITPAGSPTEEVVRGLGGKAFSYGQIEHLAAWFVERVSGQQPDARDETYASRFDVRQTTRQFASTFRQLV